MIKLVTIDLDGTLLNSKKQISKNNINAIEKARELGCKIVIATGRPVAGIKYITDTLGLNTEQDYLIVYNGGKIVNAKSKEILFSQTINGKQVKKIYNISKEYDSNIHAFCKNEDFINDHKNPYSDVEVSLNKIEENIVDFSTLEDDSLYIKTMIVDDKEKLDTIEKNLSKDIRDEFTVVRSADIFLEFLNKKVEKGYALNELADILGISHSETMAIGDAGNDLSMIVEAGIGVAMKNATTDVLTAANYITKYNNDEDGVAEALNKFVIGE